MINVQVKEIDKPEVPQYPYFGKHKYSQQIVLFTEARVGIVLVAGERPLGHYRTDWLEYNFEPLNGKLVMENK